jgi:hypothetical protein
VFIVLLSFFFEFGGNEHLKQTPHLPNDKGLRRNQKKLQSQTRKAPNQVRYLPLAEKFFLYKTLTLGLRLVLVSGKLRDDTYIVSQVSVWSQLAS